MADEFCLKMPDFHVTFRDLLHAVNLRHGTDGFTSPPRIFSPWKNSTVSVGMNPPNLGTKGQHATSRPFGVLLLMNVKRTVSYRVTQCHHSATQYMTQRAWRWTIWGWTSRCTVNNLEDRNKTKISTTSITRGFYRLFVHLNFDILIPKTCDSLHS